MSFQLSNILGQATQMIKEFGDRELALGQYRKKQEQSLKMARNMLKQYSENDMLSKQAISEIQEMDADTAIMAIGQMVQMQDLIDKKKQREMAEKSFQMQTESHTATMAKLGENEYHALVENAGKGNYTATHYDKVAKKYVTTQYDVYKKNNKWYRTKEGDEVTSEVQKMLDENWRQKLLTSNSLSNSLNITPDHQTVVYTREGAQKVSRDNKGNFYKMGSQEKIPANDILDIDNKYSLQENEQMIQQSRLARKANSDVLLSEKAGAYEAWLDGKSMKNTDRKKYKENFAKDAAKGKVSDSFLRFLQETDKETYDNHLEDLKYDQNIESKIKNGTLLGTIRQRESKYNILSVGYGIDKEITDLYRKQLDEYEKLNDQEKYDEAFNKFRKLLEPIKKKGK